MCLILFGGGGVTEVSTQRFLEAHTYPRHRQGLAEPGDDGYAVDGPVYGVRAEGLCGVVKSCNIDLITCLTGLSTNHSFYFVELRWLVGILV